MRYLLLCSLLAACGGDALQIPGPPAPCCESIDERLVCRDAACPELRGAQECTTLSATNPSYCQTPITNDCEQVYLKSTPSSKHQPFQTVYCF